MIDEVFAIEKNAIGKPVVAHELPDVLLRVEFGALRRQRHDGDVGRHDEFCGEVPQPAWSSSRMAWRPGATLPGMAVRCRVIAAVLHQGRINPTALPFLGQMAPKM